MSAPPPPSTRPQPQYPPQTPTIPPSSGPPAYPYYPSDASTSSCAEHHHAPSPQLPVRPAPSASPIGGAGCRPVEHHRRSITSINEHRSQPPSRPPTASSAHRDPNTPPVYPCTPTSGQSSPSLPPRPETSVIAPITRHQSRPSHRSLNNQAPPTSSSHSQKSLPPNVNFPTSPSSGDLNDRPLPPIPLKEGYLKYHTQVM